MVQYFKTTLVKYLLRFGVPLLGIFIFVAILRPEMLVSIIYKCCLILAGYILAELVWVIGYKRSFARIEQEGNLSDESKRSILIFRGMLHASIILGLTLGL